jgi:hypothetical protein
LGVTGAATFSSTGAFTGAVSGPTAAVDTNTTQLATTAYVIAQLYLKAATAASTYAPLTGSGASGTWAINITGDAGSVDGYSAAEAVIGSTVAARTSAGYLLAAYFNQSSSSSENPTVSSFFVENSGDGYLRKATLAHVQSQLGLSAYAVLAGNVTFTGLVKGNNGGLGLGQISVTTTTGSPAGGSNGDLVLVY